MAALSGAPRETHPRIRSGQMAVRVRYADEPSDLGSNPEGGFFFPESVECLILLPGFARVAKGGRGRGGRFEMDHALYGRRPIALRGEAAGSVLFEDRSSNV